MTFQDDRLRRYVFTLEVTAPDEINPQDILDTLVDVANGTDLGPDTYLEFAEYQEVY